MTIEALKALIDSEQFHHATYRELGTIWEGLYIYAVDPDPKWVGYRMVGSFNKRDGNLEEAEQLVAPTGVSVGAYGRG